MRQGIATADIAIEVLREFDCSLVWYGHPNLLHEIADRAGFRRGHPLNRTAAVVRVVGQSDRFEFAGVIRHLGREYRCYREKGASVPASDIKTRR